MNSIYLFQLLVPYGIGLGCGLVYYFLFVSPEFRVTRSASFPQQMVFLVGSLALHAVVAVGCFWLMNPVLAIASSFETSSIVSVMMAIICVISSLFLFGIIRVAPVRNKSFDGTNDHLRSVLRQLSDLFWTPHLLWIGMNALVIAVYFVQISDSIVAVCTGMFTAFLFWGLRQRSLSPGE